MDLFSDRAGTTDLNQIDVRQFQNRKSHDVQGTPTVWAEHYLHPRGQISVVGLTQGI